MGIKNSIYKQKQVNQKNTIINNNYTTIGT